MLRTATAIGMCALLFGAGPSSLAEPAPSANLQSASSRGGLCRADETPLFQCRVGRRHVALCARRAAKGLHVQYRYGRPGRIELAFPEHGRAGLSWARHGYSGGGELQVNADHGGHRYVLYSRTVRTRFDGNNDPAFSAGLAVVRGNRILSDRICSDTDEGWSSEADVEAWLPQGVFTGWWDLEG